ncbi:MAG: arabinosyltransferase domain-containing protein, partial [Pseudonocardiaceae bacterium]
MPESDTTPGGAGRLVWLLAVLAGLTSVLAVLVPLAPVTAEQPVVTWPRAGEQPISTVLPLVPYRPLQLEATVPCATLQALAARSGGGTALRTVPARAAEWGTQGLTVAVASGGQVSVVASGAAVLVETLPPGACEYRVFADDAGVRVERDGALVGDVPGALPPQVAELATGATGAAAAGLAVQLRPDDRYASEPAALKTVFLVAHLLALAATLAVALRVWRGRGSGLVRPRPSWADAVVVAGSTAWAVLGPVNWDDSWYSLMARNAGESGYVGNYVYMFNATENPFVLSQYLLQAWGTVGGWGLLWLRLLPLLYGLATWTLLRVLLATALRPLTSAPAARLRWAPWLLLVAHLLWWLPYGMTLRPEPLIALGAAGVLLLAELARRRRSLGVMAGATAVASLALTVAPSGLVASAPLVAALPWLLRELRERGWIERSAAVLVAGAASTVVVPIAFADASLGEVLDATATHTWYYRSFSWYQEMVHYDYLLRVADTGVWGRRAPVLLTLAVLVVVMIGRARRATVGDPARRLIRTGAATAAVALALLSMTPTKWVNHFGAVSSVGTVLLAGALLRSPLPRRAGPVITTAAVVVLSGAAALVFAGPNLWRPYSDRGQPFGDHLLAGGTRYQVGLMAPSIGPVHLRDPLVWLLTAGAVAAASSLWCRRGRRSSLSIHRGLLLAVSGLSVMLMLAVFTYAPLRQYPGGTVALSNLRALTGEPCGLASGVQVLRASGPQPQPAPAAGTGPPVRAPVEGATVWHAVPPEPPAAREQDRLVTPWFSLPDSDATHLAVPVAAGSVPGQVLRVEFGAATPGGAVPGRTVTLDLDPRAGRGTWQEVPVALGRPRPGLARVVVEDAISPGGSPLAVATPVLGRWQPVQALTAGQPVFADQLAALLWPCVDQVAIRHGIAA